MYKRLERLGQIPRSFLPPGTLFSFSYKSNFSLNLSNQMAHCFQPAQCNRYSLYILYSCWELTVLPGQITYCLTFVMPPAAKRTLGTSFHLLSYGLWAVDKEQVPRAPFFRRKKPMPRFIMYTIHRPSKAFFSVKKYFAYLTTMFCFEISFWSCKKK